MKKVIALTTLLFLMFSMNVFSQTWVDQPSGVTTSLNCVSTVDANIGWIGGNGGVILKTTNGGTNWTNVANATVGTNDVYAICALSASVAMVSTSLAATYVFRTTDGGTTWTQVFTQTGGFIDDIRFKDANNGFMYGDPVGARWSLWKTTNAGATWDSTGCFLPQVGSEAGWNNAMQIVGNTIYFGTNNTKVYKSTNFGATGSWTSGATTGTANSYSVNFNGNIGFTGQTVAVKSTDGGSTYATATLPGTGTCYSFCTVVGLNKFWYNRANIIYYSSDNGANFNTQYTGTSGAVYQAMNFAVSGTTLRGWSVSNTGLIARYTETVTPQYGLPEVLYYKFRNNPNATTVTNFATTPPSGTSTATVVGFGLTAPGQFDSCMVGNSLTGTGSDHYLNTNWAAALGTSSWTIGMWLGNLSNQTGTSACYLFGDPTASSFRCFWAGAGIGTDTAILLRYTGMPDMRLPLTTLGTFYVHFVYDATASTLKAYKNGVYVTQVAWTGINLTGTGPFKIGGYSTSANSMQTGMKMDEFRFYSRALDQTEITATWNANLGVVTGVTPITTTTPANYILSQNYPNPFNPVTKINFALPKSGFVTMKVYDVLGKEVATLVNESKVAGSYSVDFNASNLSSGIYFYKMTVDGFSEVKKMTLVK